MTTTTNMGLVLATVSSTLGPQWAQMLNTIFQQLDLHDHTTGNGSKVTPAGMVINQDLPLNGHLLQSASALTFSVGASVNTALTDSLQCVGGDLYYVNGGGAAVRLTAGSAIPVSGAGAITARVVSSYPATVLTSDAQKALIIDTTAARTVNLPAAANAMFVMIKDGNGHAATNNISVAPNGTDLVEGSNSSYLITANYAARSFVSDGVASWYVI